MRSSACLIVLALLSFLPLVAQTPAAVPLTPNPIPDAPWTTIDSFAIDPSATWVVYQADPSGANADQVFSVPVAGGTIVDVSVAGATGNIQEFEIAADGLRVVYRENNTLRSALIEGGGHAALPASFCGEWGLSPDGSMVAYIATAVGGIDGCNLCDGPFVWAVPAAGGTAEIIGLPGDTFNDWVSCGLLVVSPQGGWLSFNTYEGGQGSTLNVTTWDGSGNDALAGTVEGPAFSQFAPDDSRLFGNLNSQGLYSHSLSIGPSGYFPVWPFSYRISPVPILGRYRLVYSSFGGGDVFSIPIHQLTGQTTLLESSSSAVIIKFTSDGEDVIIFEGGNLHAVPTVGGALQTLDDSGTVVSSAYEPAPGNDYVVYSAELLQPDVYELFVVPVAGGTPLRISTDLPTWGNIFDFSISSDGQIVVYRADIDEEGVYQLFSVPITGGQSLEIGIDIEAAASRSVRSDFSITPDDGHVVYRTGFVNGDPAEMLWSVELDTDGDGDDVLDSLDCDGNDGTVWDLPDETTSLTLASQPGTGVTGLAWDEPAEPGASEPVSYEVLRSESPFVSGSNIACVSSGGTDTTTDDPDVPDDIFFYLVRAENPCGFGGLGYDSEGINRVVAGAPCAP